jgi:GAF domain
MTTIDANARQTAFEQVDAIQDLLPTLASGLDIRDIFQHLSRVASRIVPHDEADLWRLTDDGSEVRLYATTHSTPSDIVCLEGTSAIAHADQPRVLDVVPGAERGLQSGLSVPVRLDGRLVGFFALFSRRPQAYSGQDLLHADRLASYVAVALSHQRLAEQARDAAVERDRAANIETSIELLRAIADVLDIRTVFPRISEIANKVLPHDALMMVFVDQDGHIARQAASSDDLKGLPNPPSWLKPNTQPYDELLINDLRTESLPSTAPDNVREHFRSSPVFSSNSAAAFFNSSALLEQIATWREPRIETGRPQSQCPCYQP